MIVLSWHRSRVFFKNSDDRQCLAVIVEKTARDEAAPTTDSWFPAEDAFAKLVRRLQHDVRQFFQVFTLAFGCFRKRTRSMRRFSRRPPVVSGFDDDDVFAIPIGGECQVIAQIHERAMPPWIIRKTNDVGVDVVTVQIVKKYFVFEMLPPWSM